MSRAVRIIGRVLVVVVRGAWWAARLTLAMIAGAIAAGVVFVRSDRKRRGQHTTTRSTPRRMPRASGRQDYDRTYLRSQTRRVSRR